MYLNNKKKQFKISQKKIKDQDRQIRKEIAQTHNGRARQSAARLSENRGALKTTIYITFLSNICHFFPSPFSLSLGYNPKRYENYNRSNRPF